MLVEFVEESGHIAKYGTSQHVTITTSRNEIELGSGISGGPVLCRVEVIGPNNIATTAWLRARVNNRGQVQFEISADQGQKENRARVTSKWRKDA